MTPSPSIRPAVEGDLPAITDIYNESVANSTATFDTEARTTDQQLLWFKAHGPSRPILVAVDDDTVTGWAALSDWSDRRAYEETVEISVYIADDRRGQGLGRRLMEAVLDSGRKAGLHTVLSRIVKDGGASIRLHEELGFEKVGVMREVGWKFGRRIDVLLYQVMLER